MSTPSGLQDRLHKKADAELKKAIGDAFSQLQKTLNGLVNASSSPWAVHAQIPIEIKDQQQSFGLETLMRKASEAVFSQHQEANQESAVKAFMEKVDTLHEQIDELRDEINY